MSGLNSASKASSRSEDLEFIVRHSALKGYQALSLVAPAVYIAVTLFRRGRSHLRMNSLLRVTWFSGAGGALVGAGLALGRLGSATDESLQDRRFRLANNTSQIRTDDYSTIGGVLGAVATPAILWNRARLVHAILGGAGVGSSIGILIHLQQSLTDGETVKPEGMRDTVNELTPASLSK